MASFEDLQKAVSDLNSAIMSGLSEIDTRLDTARAQLDNTQEVVDHLKAVIAGTPTENPLVGQITDSIVNTIIPAVNEKFAAIHSETDELLAKGAALTAQTADAANATPSPTA